MDYERCSKNQENTESLRDYDNDHIKPDRHTLGSIIQTNKLD